MTLIKKYQMALNKAKDDEKLGCHIMQIEATLNKLKNGESPTALNEVWVDYFIRMNCTIKKEVKVVNMNCIANLIRKIFNKGKLMIPSKFIELTEKEKAEVKG